MAITSGSYTLKTSGGDYSTMKDFLNDLGNLTGNITLTADPGTYSETVVAEAVTENLNGYTLHVKPAVFPTTTDATTGAIFNINIGNYGIFIDMRMTGPGTVIIEGLVFTQVTTYPYYIKTYLISTGFELIIRRNVFKQAIEGPIYIYNNQPTYKIYNNVIIKPMQAAYSRGVYIRNTNITGFISNNTVVDSTGSLAGYGLGHDTSGKTGLFENNLVHNSKTADYISVNGSTGNNNSSKDATAADFGSGSDNRINKTTSPFVDLTNRDLRLLAGSDPIGNGKDLSAYFTTDFFGNTRSTWDIGACAYIPPTSNLKKLNGVDVALVKKINSTAIASIKKVSGI